MGVVVVREVLTVSALGFMGVVRNRSNYITRGHGQCTIATVEFHMRLIPLLRPGRLVATVSSSIFPCRLEVSRDELFRKG